MTEAQIKFQLYLTVLRFLAYKVTDNLRRIDMSVDLAAKEIMLTAVYDKSLSELELELLDDITTNSKAHIPDLIVDNRVCEYKDYNSGDHRDFTVFARYEEY